MYMKYMIVMEKDTLPINIYSSMSNTAANLENNGNMEGL
jgi:hypothetical protein